MIEPATRRSRTLRIVIVVVIVALVGPVVGATVIRVFFLEAFAIPAGSMGPTLWPGDHLFVAKAYYGLLGHEPQVGDVVVFRYPPDRTKDFVKRIVGVAGDVIELRENVLVRNGQPVPQCSLGEYEYADVEAFSGAVQTKRARLSAERLGAVVHLTLNELEPTRSDGTWTVGAGQVFVLGDNRDNSYDSRFWGGVPLADIKGRATSIWWSNQAGRAGTDLHAPPVLPPAYSEVLRRCLAELR